MRRVSTKDLTPGMFVGREVTSGDGVVLLDCGVRLTNAQIAYLQNWCVPYIYVDDSKGGTETKPEGVRLTAGEFLEKYVETIEIIKHAFQRIRYFNEIPVLQMRELADQRITLLAETVGVIEYLYDIRLHSDYTFQHSLNVAIITGILGKWRNYRGKALKNLIFAGLLHDIGKLSIPLTVLDKPSKLSCGEFEVIKQHSQAGYRLVEACDLIPDSAKLGILQHHERLDGSGYPYGTTGGGIHDFAKIIAVADIYDAMTSDRAYRRRLTPLSALEAISEQMYEKLETGICMTFLDNMRDFHSGNSVLLSNGQRAKIIVLNSRNRYWTKPVVCDANGTLIDLQEEPELEVVDLIEEG